MTDFATEDFDREGIRLSKGQSTSFAFGPPTAGALQASLKAKKALNPDDRGPPNPPSNPFDPVPPGAIPALLLESNHLLNQPGTLIGRGGIGRGGGTSSGIASQAFLVEVLDDNNEVRGAGAGAVSFDVR